MPFKKKLNERQNEKFEQQTFTHCQQCGRVVEKTFQKGICRSCLQQSFQKLRNLLNQSHAAAQEGSKGHD